MLKLLIYEMFFSQKTCIEFLFHKSVDVKNHVMDRKFQQNGTLV